MKSMKSLIGTILIAALAKVAAGQVATVTSFHYTGHLSGEPVYDEYTLVFTAYSGELCSCPIGSPSSNIRVVSTTGGAFSTTLDFGSLVAYARSGIWIGVQITDPVSVDLGRTRLLWVPLAYSSGGLVSESDSTAATVGPGWKFTQFGTGDAMEFVVSNSSSSGSAAYIRSNGTGYALSAHAEASGTAIRGFAGTSGKAGLMEITSAANSNDAFQVSTLGTGRGIKSFSAGGIGLESESTSNTGIFAKSLSGVGLRATSTVGTALDVVGTSAFSMAAAFNATGPSPPFSVASSVIVPNLNASLLGGVAGSAYATLANSQTFSGAKTFSALTTTERMIATASSILPTITVTNNGLGAAIHAEGAITKSYSGSARSAAPLAYGFVNGAGTLVSGTPNISNVLWNGSTDYVITISGESYTSGAYVVTVTPDMTSGTPATPVTMADGAGNLVVRMYKAGSPAQQSFHFIAYKP